MTGLTRQALQDFKHKLFLGDEGALQYKDHFLERLNRGNKIPFAIQILATNGHAGLINMFLQHHITDVKKAVNQKDQLGMTALHYACLGGHLEVVKVLIKYGSDVNKKTKSGSTPLTGAVDSCRLKVVEYLLDHGANPNLTGQDGDSPLSIADNQISRGKQNMHDMYLIRAALVKAGAKPVSSLPKEEQFDIAKKAMDLAVDQKRIDRIVYIARTLGPVLEDQINTLTFGKFKLPLIFCIVNRDSADYKHDLGRVMDIIPKMSLKVTDSRRWTLLHFLASQSRDATFKWDNYTYPLFEYLCKHIDVNAQDLRGKTALHIAATLGIGDAVFSLLKAGADPNIFDRSGQTALDLTTNEYCYDIISEFGGESSNESYYIQYTT